MTGDILLFLLQDGLVNGAIYALLALTFVLVFTVTRILFVPQGEFVTFGALTYASMQIGVIPGSVWMVVGGAAIVALQDIVTAIRAGHTRRIIPILLRHVLLPGGVAVAVIWAAPLKLHPLILLLLSAALVTLMGPILYRLAFRPIADASVLALLIVAVAVHFALQGMGLLFFGAEGFRGAPLFEAQVSLGPLVITGQQITVLLATLLLVFGLYFFFGRAILGKALRATAVNRLGAQLIGFRAEAAGEVAFALAAFVGAVSGVLIIGITTLYYDSGFLIGLKALVGGIFGGLINYPAAVLGAFAVGLIEAFASFWASNFKEMLVFAFLIPVLLWLSLHHHVEEEEDEDEA